MIEEQRKAVLILIEEAEIILEALKQDGLPKGEYEPLGSAIKQAIQQGVATELPPERCERCWMILQYGYCLNSRCSMDEAIG